MTRISPQQTKARTLLDVFSDAERWGAAPFFSYLEDPAAPPLEEIDYAGFYARARTVAVNLQLQGLRRGTRVAIIALPKLDYVSVFAGVILAGGVPAPVNHHFKEREIEAYLSVLDPAFVAVDDRTASVVERAIAAGSTKPRLVGISGHLSSGPGLFENADLSAYRKPEVRAEDPGLILHSSGTTGFPKAVLRSHGTITEFLDWFGDYFDDDERILNFLPLYHQAGLILSLLAGVHLGRPVVQQERYSTSSFWEVVDRFAITHVNLVAPVPTFLLSAPEDDNDKQHPLRWVVISGRCDHWADFQERFDLTAITLYGSTETLQVASIGSPKHVRVSGQKLRSMGYGILTGPEIDGFSEFRLIDERGNHVTAAGEIGHIQARGRFMFQEYLHDPDATASSFTKDGWFKTGDVAYFTAERELVLLGRAGGMIRRAGENIAPREIELVLEDHPAIQDAIVLGIRDEVQGEEIVARIVPEPQAEISAAAVFTYLEESLSAFKVPRYLVFHDRFERTPTMKIKNELYRSEVPEGDWIDRRAL